MAEHQPNTRRIPDLGRFWTIPNVLSLFRLIAAVPLAYLLYVHGPALWVLGLILLVAATDWIDGLLARWLGSVSMWGKVLDPLADKAAAAAITLALVLRESLPAWFLSIVVARDVLIVLGGVVLAQRTGWVVSSLWSGKVAVTALTLTVLAALLQADPPVLRFCIGATTALLLYAFLRYALRFVRLLYTAPRYDAAQPSARKAAPASSHEDAPDRNEHAAHRTD